MFQNKWSSNCHELFREKWCALWSGNTWLYHDRENAIHQLKSCLKCIHHKWEYAIFPERVDICCWSYNKVQDEFERQFQGLVKPCTHLANKYRTNLLVYRYCGYMWTVQQKRTSNSECLHLHSLAFPRMSVNWANVKECLFEANARVDENLLLRTNVGMTEYVRKTLANLFIRWFVYSHSPCVVAKQFLMNTFGKHTKSLHFFSKIIWNFCTIFCKFFQKLPWKFHTVSVKIDFFKFVPKCFLYFFKVFLRFLCSF